MPNRPYKKRLALEVLKLDIHLEKKLAEEGLAAETLEPCKRTSRPYPTAANQRVRKPDSSLGSRPRSTRP